MPLAPPCSLLLLVTVRDLAAARGRLATLVVGVLGVHLTAQISIVVMLGRVVRVLDD